MTEVLQLLLPLILPLMTGFLIGLMFFCGLKWTLTRGLYSKQPALWFTLSFVVRTGLALMGFYWFVKPQLQHLLISLLGFLLARLIVSWYMAATETPAMREVHYASKP